MDAIKERFMRNEMITTCGNNKCPMRTVCFKYTTKPDKRTLIFAFKKHGSNAFTCDNYAELSKEKKHI